MPDLTNEVVDFKNDLLSSHDEESNDVEKYMKLAELADEIYPCRGYGSIIRDIGKEESVHKKHLKLILDDITKWEGEDNGR